jgi:hypothetical protein
MTIAEILSGKGEDFPGLFPLIHAYLDIMQADVKTVTTCNQYMDFIVARARGELPTIAKYMRDFVDAHPDYKHDSVVSQTIASDLVLHCEKISNGVIQEPKLLGGNRTVPIAEGNDLTRHASIVMERLEKAEKAGRLRGASFHEEIAADATFLYRCSLVRSLVDKYKNHATSKYDLSKKGGFSSTPAFLSGVPGSSYSSSSS